MLLVDIRNTKVSGRPGSCAVLQLFEDGDVEMKKVMVNKNGNLPQLHYIETRKTLALAGSFWSFVKIYANV